ncbi:MAG: hypothetical protein IJO88_06285 [Oscillospiraceae bacterium]|nr:hypothetical protein [Oscillibacter sp.]MBQ9968312.1 hypothetical protein [Oscillospiraceae bacterium]
MVIRKMTATFGCLDGAVLELRDGVNMLRLPNEGGKSTWAAFLCAMFYGLDPTRAGKGRLSGKERYLPWNGKPMEGTLELELQGRTIVLQRSSESGKPFGVFRAWDKTTGAAIDSLNGENCGRQLLGVEREVFRRTAFLSGEDLTVTREIDLTRRLEQLAAAGRETDSFLEAENRLRAWQNKLRYHRSGEIPAAKERLDELLLQREKEPPFVEGLPDLKTLLRLQLRLEMTANMHKAPPALQGVPEEKIMAKAKRDLFLYKLQVFGGFTLSAVLMVLGQIYSQWLLLGALWAAVVGAWPLLSQRLLRTYHAPQMFSVLTVAAACLEACQLRRELPLVMDLVREFAPLAETVEQASGAVREAIERRKQAERMERVSPEEIEALRAKIRELERREQAIVLARQALAKANGELRDTYVPKLTSLAGEYLQVLTMGRYESLVMDESLQLSVREQKGMLRPLSALSAGARDQAWLALRLAMTQLLLPKGSFLVLDDALLTFDPRRELLALELLENLERQVLCFSCR